jgi:hypothetical protein
LSEVISNYVTITCDATGCDKTVTFLGTDDGGKKVVQENPWMNSLRTVQTISGRKFIYCSDECEAKGVGAGSHNQQVIVTPQAGNAVDLAAQAAERARQATEALKTGHGNIALS